MSTATIDSICFTEKADVFLTVTCNKCSKQNTHGVTYACIKDGDITLVFSELGLLQCSECRTIYSLQHK